ncbi:hypothetical protein OJF2_34930 [Aquisphaera giovannonii]|uniref:DUF4058 family protein n=1 Tax=Aquisphaera giovannonii TaxID=406548 RepID=A0A5B9W2X4_9BACT|nr:DUF4058 family protein [Aquisphaera giovannonii]QEH34948.1 hypothetical protein OJF2_34930 [Aquisphaera giovannonii]
MAGPFPGMDPYIEAQIDWEDFHNNLISEMRTSLSKRLPGDYVARSDTRIEVIDVGEDSTRIYKPDVLLAHRRGSVAPQRSASPEIGESVAILEPWQAEVTARDPEEVRTAFLEIRRLPDLELVTVVEVLSPSNKAGLSRQDYMDKRQDLYERKINLVEIDLLLGGHRVPMKPPLRGADYFAVVARGATLPQAQVYGWTVRDPLPTLPIPLKAPAADLSIHLGELASRVYENGLYDRTLRYDLPLPREWHIRPEDREWAQGQGGRAS